MRLTLLAPIAAALALALVTGCAHSKRGSTRGAASDEDPDATLDELDGAFAALRDDDRARELLERATARFDDLALEGTTLEKAFVSDASKPYRGRPHERVLAATDPAQPSDAALVHALALRCSIQTKAGAADIERARDDLRSALSVSGDGHRLPDIEALVLADELTLALDGVGPEIAARGAHGERASVVPSDSPTSSRAARVDIGADAAFIHLGEKPRHSRAVKKGLALWSSTHQARTVHERLSKTSWRAAHNFASARSMTAAGSSRRAAARCLAPGARAPPSRGRSSPPRAWG